tara:strand:- start:8 stop:211 length:204 start_codon:yes stop_codon:yes gene_type:complete
MSLITWSNEKIKKLDFFDITLIKIGAAAMALFIAKLWTPILYLKWHWCLGIAIVVSIKPMMKIFSKN